MKSLLSNSVLSLLKGWQDFSQAVKTLSELKSNPEDNFPVKIEGLQGASIPFFAASYIDAVKNNVLYNLQYSATGRYSQERTSTGKSHTNFSTSLDSVFVVPSEKDALQLSTDLETAFEGEVEVYTLPWWGTVPYRPANPGSAVYPQWHLHFCLLRPSHGSN